ncbi:MAG: FtsW/RodA/SpoVE family cell cycle protein [Clostridia bacterium]|nr:FtsW/RodA/SpoVE family cell cycle protein [Clostridia bacterium]
MTVTEENRRSRAHTDGILLAMVFAMSLFGVVAVCVATYTPDSTSDTTFLNHIVESSYAMRQCLFLLVAPLVVGVIMAFPFDILRRRAEWIYWGAFILLTITTVFNRAQGVKAWLDVLWGYTIQPSEFAKLAMILILAKNLAKQDRPLSDRRSFTRVFLMVIVPGLVILLQGETGSLLVIIFLFAVMMYFANVSMKTLGILFAIAAIGILSLYGFMMATGSDDYRLARIAGWLDPELYSSSDAYQQTMSKMTIGSGGISGNGMFQTGAISQLNYVPADWTDFIYATIGETWGLVGCVAILVWYFLILLRMLYLAWYTRDKFGRLIIIGVMGMLLFHVLENIAMTLGLMPITGIPLPFLSYGGSNMMTNMGGIGLVLNVTRNRSISISVNTPQTLHNPYRIHKQFRTRNY